MASFIRLAVALTEHVENLCQTEWPKLEERLDRRAADIGLLVFQPLDNRRRLLLRPEAP
jgi:hypothetical protein